MIKWLIFIMLIVPYALFAQAPVITSGTPITAQGNTFQFTATGAGITWSVAGHDGGSINSSTGLYTAPASFTANHSFAGCQIFSNEHIYNTDISGLSADVNSGTWVTALTSERMAFNIGAPEIPNNFSTTGPTQVMNLTITTGVSGNYTVLLPPWRREQSGYKTYTQNPPTSFDNQDHHFWMTYPSTCAFSEIYQLQSTTVAYSANSVNYSDFVLPVNQGVDAGGDWMFALSIKAAELEAAVASGATTLKHATRVTLANGIICDNSTLNACGENAAGTRHIWPATSEAFAGGGTIPYGACIRLKAATDISTFTAVEKIILNTWKHYCIFVTDGTIPSDNFSPTIEAGPYSLANITGANLPASDFEFVNIQSLMVSSTSGAIATNGPDQVTATNGSGSASQYVMVIGPTIGLPYDDVPYSHLTFQAGTAAFQLSSFVNGNGTASSAVTWSMSPSTATYGTITSGGLYTPPATVSGAALTTVATATMAADANQTAQVYINIIPTGTMRFILNGQCGANVSFTSSTSFTCQNATTYTDGSSHVWQGTLPAWSLTEDNCGGFSPNSGDPQLFEIPGAVAGFSVGGDARFDFHVPNGVYQIVQNFMVDNCSYNDSAGKQFETIEIQGTPVLTNLDIAATAGLANPLTETFNGNVVSNGVLSVILRATGVGPVGPTISSMQITQSSPTVPAAPSNVRLLMAGKQ